MSGYPDKRATQTYVHKEHYNAQLVIQHVVNDTHSGKTVTDVVRVNLTTRESDGPSPERLDDVRRRMIRHIQIAFDDIEADLMEVVVPNKTTDRL